VTGHLVQRVRFEVHVGSKAQALAVQDCISQFRSRQLESVLDSCLSGLVPDNRVLSLDTLDLELGEVTEKQMESELAPRIESALTEALLTKPVVDSEETRGFTDEGVPIDTHRLRQLAEFLQRGVLRTAPKRYKGFRTKDQSSPRS
jgi:hypothetical protein